MCRGYPEMVCNLCIRNVRICKINVPVISELIYAYTRIHNVEIMCASASAYINLLTDAFTFLEN